jgi:hypothetical protein
MWDWAIRAKRVTNLLPVLETVLAGIRWGETDGGGRVSPEARVETE